MNDATRARIVAAAYRILAKQGREGLTTRAVAEAAGVQQPAIYREFVDKRGLLDALVAHGVARYFAEKAAHIPHADPIEDLRAGWDGYVAFGLANPAIAALLADPELKLSSAQAGLPYLEARVHRAALAGRLRVSEPQAVSMLHAAGMGTVLALLERPDPELSAATREAILAAIAHSPRAETRPIASAVIALRAALPELVALTPRERDLLDEWLARLTTSRAGGGARPAARD